MFCTLLLQSWLSTFDDDENDEGLWTGNERGREEAPETQGTRVRPLPCARVMRIGKSLLTGRNTKILLIMGTNTSRDTPVGEKKKHAVRRWMLCPKKSMRLDLSMSESGVA